MALTSWHRPHSPRVRRRPTAARLSLERLEDRRLLDAAAGTLPDIKPVLADTAVESTEPAPEAVIGGQPGEETATPPPGDPTEATPVVTTLEAEGEPSPAPEGPPDPLPSDPPTNETPPLEEPPAEEAPPAETPPEVTDPGTPPPVTGEIPPTLSIGDVAVTEGDAGTTDAAFTVLLSAPAAQDVTFQFATHNASAQAGADYTAASGSATIPAGATSTVIAVQVLGDGISETNETFFLTLTSPVNAVIADSTGQGAIRDDDATRSVQLAATRFIAAEDSGAAVVSLRRSGDLAGVVTAQLTTANGTARGGSDYAATSLRVTFEPGQTSQTVLIPLTVDAAVESHETFSVRLSSPTGAGLGAPSSAVVTITDEGTPVGRYVSRVYLDLLGREADAAALAYWSGVLGQGVPRGLFVLTITNSSEYQAHTVQGLYGVLLNRPVDAGGLDHWVRFLQQGGTAEQLASVLAGSAEYYQRGGGTSDGFLDALFHQALHRAADEGAQEFYGGLLDSGRVTTFQVAAEVFHSDEFRRHQVNFPQHATAGEFVQHGVVHGWFQHFLGRPADAAGLNFYAAALGSGVRDEQVIAALLASDEYFARG